MLTLHMWKSWGRVTPTRFDDGEVSLHVTKVGDDWRVLANQDGACDVTGGHAKTKFECFTCVLPTVAKNWGFDKD